MFFQCGLRPVKSNFRNKVLALTRNRVLQFYKEGDVERE
jgi:hypothetical protein